MSNYPEIVARPAWMLSPAPEGTPRCGVSDRASGATACVLAAGHGGNVHQDRSTNQWPVSDRAYPIRPRPEDDPRFTFGLTRDVAAVLENHGYPPITTAVDFVELQQALFRFLYAGPDTEATA